MANNFYSPLRYPGGKTKIAPIIKKIFDENNIVGCHYVEPYAGGAGVALSLLLEEFVSTVQINDYDRSIYAFWYTVVNQSEDFCKQIERIPITIKEWLKQKKIQKNKTDVDLFDLGFSTFFLNRTNISGVIKGGVIGGIEQQGEYKINARFNKEKLIERIRRISKYANRIEVTNENALNIFSLDLSGDFVFIDPPYVNKAKDLYLNFYSKEDHITVSDAILKNKSDFNWLLTYDQNNLIKKLYASCKHKFSYELSYGASNRKSREYLFFSNKLKTHALKDCLKTVKIP